MQYLVRNRFSESEVAIVYLYADAGGRGILFFHTPIKYRGFSIPPKLALKIGGMQKYSIHPAKNGGMEYHSIPPKSTIIVGNLTA